MKRLRTLLMSPLMSYKDRWGQYHRGAGDTFPIGLGSIAGYLEAGGHPVDVIEPDLLGLDAHALRSLLIERRYDVIGVSAFTPNVAFAFPTATLIKSADPSAKVVLGGAHPTLFPERTLSECGEIDYLVTHEGEIPMARLLDALERNESPDRVPHLWYREGDRLVESQAKAGWLDLNALPLFPYEKFPLERYTPAPSLRRVLPTFNYMAQRGCPFDCSFCDTRTHGRMVRYRDIEKVVEDLDALKKTYSLRGLIFEGSNFTVDPRWVRDLCTSMISRRFDLSFYCMGRVDLDPDLLPLMKKAGLWCMSFGIESANPATLQKMNKRLSADEARATLRQIRRLGIRSIGSFILGYPGETESDVIRTIDLASELDLDVAVFFIPVPFPGTRLWEHTLASGGLRQPIEWRDYAAWLDHNNPIYINPLLGKRHVILYNTAYRKFYLRPRYLLRQLRAVTSFTEARRLLLGFKSVRGLIWMGIRALWAHGRGPR